MRSPATFFIAWLQVVVPARRPFNWLSKALDIWSAAASMMR
jgi:hypothetical protein